MDSPENRPRADSWNPHIFSLACGSLRIPVGPSQPTTQNLGTLTPKVPKFWISEP